MTLHPDFPASSYAERLPDQRWFLDAEDAGIWLDVGRVSPPRRNPTTEAAGEMSGYAALTRPTVNVEERWTGRYTVAMKVIDIFGNSTIALIPASVG